MKITYPPPAELKKFLTPYDREIQQLALSLRALILEEMAPCYENIYDAYSAVAIGYGTSDRLRDGVFHIAVYSKHVNLGFNDGATLDDPKGILQGSGNQIRHITIKSTADLERPEQILERGPQEQDYRRARECEPDVQPAAQIGEQQNRAGKEDEDGYNAERQRRFHSKDP